MSVAPRANPGRRAARLVAALGLSVGGICLLFGAVVYLGAAPDVLPATWIETTLPEVATHLTLAAVVVLGTILVSIGTVFALLERTGILAAVTVPRHEVDALEPPHDHAAPESRHGDRALGRSNLAEVPARARDHGVGPRGAVYVEPGAFASRGAARDVRTDSRTSGVSRRDTPGGAPIGNEELTETRAAGLGSEEAAGAQTEVQPPVPGAPLTEAEEPQLVAGEPPPARVPQPGDLIAAWNDYRREGDGHFSHRGLQGVLDRRGLEADVSHGDRVGAGGAVLVVETPSDTPNFYVLPSFNKSPRAVADWFDDDSDGALTGRTRRVTRVAQGRWGEHGTGIGRRFEVLERGEIA